jgi:hypothetical protein
VRLFKFTLNKEEWKPQAGAQQTESVEPQLAVGEPKANETTGLKPQLVGEPVSKTAAAPKVEGKFIGFEQIYQNAAIRPVANSYSILKVAEMVNSSHLSGMPSEAKRCSLLMALEAAGAEVENLLQDAVIRQRALNDYETAQQNRVKELEAAKAAENRKIQEELERLTSHYMSMIQANLDEVSREQENFRSWQQRKQEESLRITEAAAICVPQGGSEKAGTSLTAVLERAMSVRR